MYMLVALIDMFVIKLFSYDLKDHTFILQTPASTTPFRLYNGWYHPRTSTSMNFSDRFQVQLSIVFCLQIWKPVVRNIQQLRMNNFLPKHE